MDTVYFYGYIDSEDEIRLYGVKVSDDDVFQKADDILAEAEAETETAGAGATLSLHPNKGLIFSVKRPIGVLGFRLPRPTSICHGVSILSRCVALGPYIYCLGGYEDSSGFCSPIFHDKVHRWDTRESRPRWESCTPMKVARKCPQMAAIDGKLFVFGCTLKRIKGEWAEYFDPTTNKWEFLPDLPVEYNMVDRCPVAAINADEHKKMIVLCNTANTDMLCFDVKKHSWTFMDDDGGVFQSCHDRTTGTRINLRCSYPSAVAGCTIYWFSSYELCVYAYDVFRKKWLSAPVKNFTKQGHLDEICCFETLLHLHDELFCVVWPDQRLHKETKLIQIRCTKLQISKRECTLRVVVKSTQTYLVDDFNLADAVLVGGALEENIKSSTDEDLKKRKRVPQMEEWNRM